MVGWKARPTALRRPEAKIVSPEPSALKRSTAARRLSLSRHTLQDEPTETYMSPSGPKTTVRVQCPPPAGRRVSRVGCVAFMVAGS